MLPHEERNECKRARVSQRPSRCSGWSDLAAILLPLSVTTSRAHAAELGCAANGYYPEFREDYGTSLDSSETWLVIDGDPIKYAAGSRGGVAVWVC